MHIALIQFRLHTKHIIQKNVSDPYVSGVSEDHCQFGVPHLSKTTNLIILNCLHVTNDRPTKGSSVL